MVTSGQRAPMGVYVYCIVPARPQGAADPPVYPPGLGDKQVRAVDREGLVAIVSDAETMRYDISRENLLAHERVVEGAMATHCDVLPMRFGTIAASDEAICDGLLTGQRAALLDQLERVRGCVELGIMARWVRDELFASIVSESAQIRALRDEIAAKPKDATYFDRLTLGQLTDDAISERSKREAASLLDAVEGHAREIRINDPIGDMMLLNAAFLVRRGDVQAFDAKVAVFDNTTRGWLTLKYVGPLPPYNFVDLALRPGD